jgi:hypothetical protein
LRNLFVGLKACKYYRPYNVLAYTYIKNPNLSYLKSLRSQLQVVNTLAPSRHPTPLIDMSSYSFPNIPTSVSILFRPQATVGQILYAHHKHGIIFTGNMLFRTSCCIPRALTGCPCFRRSPSPNENVVACAWLSAMELL